MSAEKDKSTDLTKSDWLALGAVGSQATLGISLIPKSILEKNFGAKGRFAIVATAVAIGVASLFATVKSLTIKNQGSLKNPLQISATDQNFGHEKEHGEWKDRLPPTEATKINQR